LPVLIYTTGWREALIKLRPIHTTQQEFESGDFTMKTLQIFKTATITGQFGFVFEKNSVWEIT